MLSLIHKQLELRHYVTVGMHRILILLAMVLGIGNADAQISVANINISIPTTQPDSIITSQDTIEAGSSVTLSLSGGYLGDDASWTWYESSCGTSVIGTGASINVLPLETTTYYCTAIGGCNTISCMAITITVSSEVLPLDFLSFTAKLYQENKGWLEWVTTNESNTAHFIIEKSLNGKDYTYAGRVEAENTAGNHQYHWIDNLLNVGINFYRLKIVDGDGSFKLSAIRTINYAASQKETVKLYPNPTDGALYFELESDEEGAITTWVSNIVSQEVTEQKITKIVPGKNIIPITVTGLADGAYLLFYQLNNHERHGIRFIKNAK